MPSDETIQAGAIATADMVVDEEWMLNPHAKQRHAPYHIFSSSRDPPWLENTSR